MPEPLDGPDELGSLAQNARKASLKNARVTLFVLAGLQTVAGLFFFIAAEPMAKSQVEKEVRAAPGMQFDPADIKKAEADGAAEMRLAGGFVGGLGIAFFVLGTLVYQYPVATTVTALVLFVGVHLLDAMFDPLQLVRGIIIKVIIVVALVKAIKAALAYEQEARESRPVPESF